MLHQPIGSTHPILAILPSCKLYYLLLWKDSQHPGTTFWEAWRVGAGGKLAPYLQSPPPPQHFYSAGKIIGCLSSYFLLHASANYCTYFYCYVVQASIVPIKADNVNLLKPMCTCMGNHWEPNTSFLWIFQRMTTAWHALLHRWYLHFK